MRYRHFGGARRIGVLIAMMLAGIPNPSLLAQRLDPDKALTQYVHDVWNKKDGLPHGTVRAIVQTQDGYVWLGTHGGLVRFDGVRFEVFDKSNTPAMRRSMVTALAESPDGTLWIGTYGGGVLHYDNGRFTSYTTADGLTSDKVSSLSVDAEGVVWVGTRGGFINRIEASRIATYQREQGVPHVTINATLVTPNGDVWIGTNRGLARLEQDGFGLPIEELARAYVRALAPSRDGSLWIGSDDGLHRFHEGTLTPWTPREGSFRVVPRVLFEDEQGTLWIGTGRGVVRIAGDTVDIFTTRHGLSHNAVQALYQDREGGLWIGTDDGLNRLQDRAFTSYGRSEGLPADFANAVFQHRDGRLLVSSGNRLSLFRNGRFEPLDVEGDLPSALIHTLAEDEHGDLWIGGKCMGVLRLRNGRLTVYGQAQGLGYLCVTALIANSDGGLSVATDGGGLYRYREGRFSKFSHARMPALAKALVEDPDGTLWIGTWAGLGRLRGDDFRLFTTEDGLAGDDITTLHVDPDGALWVGTSGGGLSRVRGEQIDTFSARDGLYDDNITGITQDDQGNLWISSSQGIFRVALENLHDVAEGRATMLTGTIYTEQHGLESSEGMPGQPAALRSQDGRLWFATRKGVAVVDPAETHINAMAPPVVIEQIVVDGQPVDRTERVVLAPGAEDFEFHYAGLSFVAPENMQFRYRLEGRDEAWTEAGARRVAYYTDLRPGPYTFHVHAANSDGVWNRDGASFTFYLKPFFYQTMWFYGFCALGLLTLGAVVYGLRVRQLKKRAHALRMLVDERTESLRHEKEKTETLYQQLEADHARQKQELEEARALQLSMLPDAPPRIKGLAIAVHMSTATEVGGDYYDFRIEENGALTVAIGDATGHGMKAGLVVATTKSYFQTFSSDTDSVAAARQLSRSLKDMNLPRMYMCLMLLRYQHHVVRIMSAGMPPALLYRQAGQTVERIVLKGMPLGSFPDFPYQERSLALERGDTLLLMSDGLMEQFNAEREILDEGPIQACLHQAAPHGPETVVTRLLDLVRQWSDGCPQNDDITLIVMQVTG